MRPGISLTVTAADRCRLAVIAGDRNTPQKHVWRAEIVLLTADGIGTVEIMRRTGKSKTCEGTRRSACGMVAPGPNSWLAACAGMLRCSMHQRVYSASVPEPQATGITIVNRKASPTTSIASGIVSTTEDGPACRPVLHVSAKRSYGVAKARKKLRTLPR